MSILKQIERIKYIDELIRNKRANTPYEISKKTSLSERQIFSIIQLMKELGAPIKYCRKSKQYHYVEKVKFICKFDYFID